jgi:hypothetical protein
VKPAKKKCIAKVWRGRSMIAGRCENNAIDDYCRRHDPVAAEKKREATLAAHKAQQKISLWERRRGELEEKAYECLLVLSVQDDKILRLQQAIIKHEAKRPEGAE